MKTTATLAVETTFETATTDFWAKLLEDETVKALDHLEQLITGCEIIAALDDLGLLAEAA